MTVDGYLDKTRGLTRLVEKALVAVGLLDPHSSATNGAATVDTLLHWARISLLPFMLIFNMRAQESIRLLAVRQYVLLAAIMICRIAVPFLELFAMIWIGMYLLNHQVYDLVDPGPDRVEFAIAQGGLLFFGKVVLVCVALASLCPPIRSPRTEE